MKVYKYNFNLPNTKTGKDAGQFFFWLCMALVAICLLMLTIRWVSYKPEPKDKAVVPNVHSRPHVCTRHIDVLGEETLADLIITLKKREGLKLKPYYLDSSWYIGYGHKILKNEKFVIPFDTVAAHNLLIKDIEQSYEEYVRIHKKQIVKDMYHIFISGQPHKPIRKVRRYSYY